MQDLRQQQDEAYELSLRADQEKERLKQVERDRVLQQQMEEETERLEQQRQKEVSIYYSKKQHQFYDHIQIIWHLNSIGHCTAKDRPCSRGAD